MSETGTWTREHYSCGKWYTQTCVTENGRVLVVSEEPRKPNAIGYHSDVVKADGRPLNYGGMAGEMWSDYRGEDALAQATAAAHRTLATHPLAAAVHISESVQEFEGQCWKAGRHVATITREG